MTKDMANKIINSIDEYIDLIEYLVEVKTDVNYNEGVKPSLEDDDAYNKTS